MGILNGGHNVSIDQGWLFNIKRGTIESLVDTYKKLVNLWKESSARHLSPYLGGKGALGGSKKHLEQLVFFTTHMATYLTSRDVGVQLPYLFE